MTEDEARMKWCPHAVASHTDPRQIINGHWLHNCIASGCMAWRVRHQWLDNAQQEPDWVSYEPYAFEPGSGQERDDGYCGLSGEPR